MQFKTWFCLNASAFCRPIIFVTVYIRLYKNIIICQTTPNKPNPMMGASYVLTALELSGSELKYIYKYSGIYIYVMCRSIHRSHQYHFK
jgi:hypothetical protein